MIEVILFQDIDSLGKVGDVIKVKDGYARNYLIPRKKAYLATSSNLKRIERQKVKEQKQYEDEKKKARELSDKLGKVSCTVTVEVNDLEKMIGIPKNDFANSMFKAKSSLSGSNLANIIKTDYVKLKYGNKNILVSQLEITEAKKVIEARIKDIKNALTELKKENESDITFLNIIRLDKGSNFIYAPDQETKNLLSKVLKVNFKDYIAKTKSIYHEES